MNLLKGIKRRFVVWVWNHTPNCADMSRLTSRSLDEPLSLKLRLKMRLHHSICAWCRRYFEQLHFLHKAAPRLGVMTAELPGRGLSEEARQRIRRVLSDRR